MKHHSYVVAVLAAALSLSFGCGGGELPSCKAGEDVARAVQTARAGRHEALKQFLATDVERTIIAAKAFNPDGNDPASLEKFRDATDRAIRFVAETDAAEWKRLCGN